MERIKTEYDIDTEAKKCIDSINNEITIRGNRSAADIVAEYMRKAVFMYEEERKRKFKIKLSDAQVLEILASTEASESMARKYNVTGRYIRYIRRGAKRSLVR